jgi:hypothetical protein
MPLVKPALTPASPGQPITAQAWNIILTAIGELYDAMLAIGGNAANIELRHGTTAIVDAKVVAVPTTGQPVSAVPPRAGGTAFTLTGMNPGAWTVHVEAPGYQTASASITVPVSGTTTINLTPNTVVMPNLIGATAASALSTLNGASIQIDMLLDITGDQVSKTALPSNKAGSIILFQFPVPGTRVTAASAGTKLVLSEDLDSQVTTVPTLKGLTYSQLIAALNAAGLKLGNVSYTTK